MYNVSSRFKVALLTEQQIRFIQEEAKETKPTWSRAPGQMCKIPKTEQFEIPTPELGCLLMSFSTDGRFVDKKFCDPVL